MGCDIHMYIEYKKNGKWEADKLHEPYQDEWDDDGDMTVDSASDGGRNYAFFGALAGVRSAAVHQLFSERGVPDDVSKHIKMAVEQYGGDGHTHSYLSLDEFKQCIDHYNKTIDEEFPDDRDYKIDEEDGYFELYEYCKKQVDKHNSEAILLDAPHLKIEECRIVFFFDN